MVNFVSDNMRKLIVLFSCMLVGIVSAYAQNEKTNTETYKDTLFVPYHVKNMTILLDNEPVDYTVVFDTVSGYKRPEYIQVGGSTDSFNAIKMYGERYRKGILIYRKAETTGGTGNEK